MIALVLFLGSLAFFLAHADAMSVVFGALAIVAWWLHEDAAHRDSRERNSR